MVIRFPDMKDVIELLIFLFGFVCDHFLEILQGILIVCFITIVVAMSAWLVVSEPGSYSREIDAQRYDMVDTWLSEEPEIKPFVMECLKNDTITYKEYRKIEKYKQNVHRTNTKDSLKYKIRSR